MQSSLLFSGLSNFMNVTFASDNFTTGKGTRLRTFFHGIGVKKSLRFTSTASPASLTSAFILLDIGHIQLHLLYQLHELPSSMTCFDNPVTKTHVNTCNVFTVLDNPVTYENTIYIRIVD